jgi:hypothetical protein
MRLDNYSITLTQYVWPIGTDPTDVNICNISNATTVISIDLKPYIIDMGEMSWSLDTVDEEDGKSNMFFEDSDVPYTLSATYNNGYLMELLGIYRDTNFEKYVIEVVDVNTNRIIHKGVVSQEMINVDFKPDKDNKIIEINAFGFMKELKNHYSSKAMLHNDTELEWTRKQHLPNVVRRDSYDRWGCSMYNLLRQSFSGSNINFVLDTDVSQWYIAKNPILGKRTNYIGIKPDNTCWIKSSYERIRANGENRFDLIRRLCNAMGWIFYFSDNNFYVKNKVPVENAHILDFNRIMPHSLHKQKDEIDFEHIVILNGLISVGLAIHDQGWGHMDGTRMRIFTPNPTSAKERWWNDIPSDWNLLGSGINPDINFKVQKNYNEDSNYFRYCLVGNSLGGWYIAYIFALKQSAILFIDAGETGSSAWGYDTTSGETFPRDFTYDPGEEEIQFTGNYGSAMFKITGQFPNQQVYTYEDYKESSIFNNNFQKYYNSNLSRRITLEYPEVISNPLQKYTFINDNGKLAGEWTTVSLKTNILTKVSTLELQLKED